MKPNKLITESSPYLLQHAHNPVKWYPWGDEAFEKAKTEDKLILVSVGYSACHWCHVMEHESFEDEGVAEIMNQHFVCIKVDREERPDIDQVYMEAVQMISGQGGWPLNCFALPDGQPVWGGTYFPKEQWIQVLTTLRNLYHNERDKILDQAQHLTEGIRQQDFPELSVLPQSADEDNLISNLTARFDTINGGLGSAPKFPMPISLELILQLGYIKNNNALLDFVFLTLDKMASGGIYDQVGGGFARYSVDERWFAPHFEKMMYDNAQLISLYSNAYKISGNTNYARIIDETFEFIQRELTSVDGAFYAALDADSEGKEGKFYIWSFNELKEAIGDDKHFFNYFSIDKNGNWEDGVNILHAVTPRNQYATDQDLEPREFESKIQQMLLLLLNKRNKRIRPCLDDKILTSWNALTIISFCDAYQALGNEKFLVAAEKAINYLRLIVVQKDGTIHRSSKDGVSKIQGFLDDYAFYIQALIKLYEVTFTEAYILEALATTQFVIDHFYDETNGIFYYTSSKSEKLIARKTDIQDNVIPSSVGTMTKNLIQLSQIMHLPDYETIADMLITKMHDQIEKNPSYYAQWALLSSLRHARNEVVICGTNAELFRKELQTKLRPGTIYAGSSNSENRLDILKDRFQTGKTLIYHCKNKSCELPIDDPQHLVV